jgi:hypothetical protein
MDVDWFLIILRTQLTTWRLEGIANPAEMNLVFREYQQKK